MAKKYGTLKCKKLFLGVDSGQRSTEVVATATELNQLDGGIYTGNVTGDVTGSASEIVTGTPVLDVAAACTLTVSVQPTAGDTFTIGTRTYTFTTDETADAAGEIDVGADLADAKTRISRALDGTDTWETANAEFTYGAWATDDLVLTYATAGVVGNSVPCTETFDNAGNVFDAAVVGTTTAGVDGTVAAKGAILWDATHLYVATAANTTADSSNWMVVQTITDADPSTAEGMWNTVTTAATDVEDGTATVQFVFKDAAGTAMTGIVSGEFYISEVATGATVDAADTSIAVLTNGVINIVDTGAASYYNFITDATGKLGLTITSNDDNYWIVFRHPTGKIVPSGVIAISGN